MKDSGLKWVGQIPAEWRTSKLDYLVRYAKGLNITKADLVSEGVPVISYGQIHAKTNDGVHLYEHLLRFVPKELAEGHAASRLKEGDFVFADTSEDHEGVGNCVRVDMSVVVYAGYHTLIARPIDIENSHYLAYLFRCDSWRQQLRAKAIGTKVFTISQKMLHGVSVLLPPLPEQRAIAAKLDALTSRIDSESNKITAEIVRLDAYKKSVITEVVCRGLDPKVKMKDSGIPWIGKIPEGWSNCVLSSLVRQVKDKNIGMKEKNLLSLSYGRIIRKDIDRTSGLMPDNYEGYNVIRSGDVVLRLTDLQNDKRSIRVGLAYEKGIITSAYVTVRPNASCESEYLAYALLVFDIKKGFYGVGSGVRQGLTYDELKRMKLSMPPFDEQRKIAAYIDATCARVDAIIAKRKRQLERLDALKRSLVYEYVTGKREV